MNRGRHFQKNPGDMGQEEIMAENKQVEEPIDKAYLEPIDKAYGTHW